MAFSARTVPPRPVNAFDTPLIAMKAVGALRLAPARSREAALSFLLAARR
jgi:hypothetical protein